MIKRAGPFKVGERAVICPKYSNSIKRGTEVVIKQFNSFTSATIALLDDAGNEVTQALVDLWRIRKIDECAKCPVRICKLTSKKCPASWKDITKETE